MMKPIHAFLVLLLALPLQAKTKKDILIQVCPDEPLRLALIATPAQVSPGRSTTLTWTTNRATQFTLSDMGPVTGPSVVVTPVGLGDHVYTLSGAEECGQKTSASVTVTVRKLKVYLTGSRYSSGPSIADYMMTPGMYCYDCIGGARALAAADFVDSHAKAADRAAFDEFMSTMKHWPRSVQAYNTAHVGGNTYVVDELGDVLGSMPTMSIYDTGVPGLSFVGDPWATNNRNRIWVGDAEFTFGGESYEVVGFLSASPIILDLDGDDKPDVDRGEWLPHPARFNRSKSVLFDITATGFPSVTEWVGPKDGLLVAPLAAGEPVRGGEKLFGNPIGFLDGYQKLGLRFDKDDNGVIEGKELDGLLVWQDLNGNARSEPDELKPVQEFKITKIGTKQDNLKSSFTIDGKERSTWDWWPTCMLVYPKPVAKGPAEDKPKL